MKYSVWMIIFGLIFAFSFQANKVQIPQILEKPIRIVPGTKGSKQYLVSGWQGAYAKGRRSILRVSLPEEKTYPMVIRAFSCSPPDARDQRMEVHFNDVALDRLKFRKTSKWQKFSVDIPSYLIKETNTIKFVYTQDTHLSPIAFDYLEFRNYIFRIKSLYLLFDLPGRINYLTSRAIGYSFAFALFFLFFWLFYSRFLSFAVKIKFSRAIRIDFLNYLPSIILLSTFALYSFFSPCHFVYSLKTFFVLAIVPTAVLKLFPYRDLPLRLARIVFRFILRNIEKTFLEVKRAFSFLKTQGNTFRKFLIRYHKKNYALAFIQDFMILLLLCLLLSIMRAKKIAEGVAILAYFLLVMGVAVRLKELFRENKRE